MIEYAHSAYSELAEIKRFTSINIEQILCDIHWLTFMV